MTGMSALGGMQAGTTRAFQPPSFSKLDSDSSGGITLEEFESSAPGGVSSAQSSAQTQKMFAAMDSDSDGSVTENEKNAFDSAMQDRMASMNFSAQMMGGSAPSSSVANDIVSALDTDDDGAVSLEELSASDAAEGLDEEDLQKLFAALDEDSNGSVSTDEIDSFLEANAPQGGPRGAGGPPPPPPPSGAESSDEDEEDETAAAEALELLTAALEAYQSSTTSADSLTGTFLDSLEEAA